MDFFSGSHHTTAVDGLLPYGPSFLCMPHQFLVGFEGEGVRGENERCVNSRNKKKKRKQHFFAVVVLGFNTIPVCIIC
jgi:hypothetical protein